MVKRQIKVPPNGIEPLPSALQANAQTNYAREAFARLVSFSEEEYSLAHTRFEAFTSSVLSSFFT